ncbi:MAG TPA: PEP-CTERM sorting domain-containing protein [Candidatus Binatia bacterium]|nr:PEP-CTERM sorting domain-containing protein [Candidatus Binatia bacterium]
MWLVASQLKAATVGVEYPTSGEGNTNSIVPFSYIIDARYQQVYDAARFAIPFQGNLGRLEYIAFRLDSPAGYSSLGTYTNVQISLSTTPASEGSLSPVFVQNVGLDATVIFSGTLTWGASHAPGPGPQNWDLILTPTAPFLYDPSRGNLLLDYRGTLSTTGPNGFGPLDAYRLAGDGTASVFAAPNSGMGTVDTTGLTTFFGFTLVPEPDTIVLFGIGAAVLWVIRGPMRKRKNACH